MFNQNHVKIMNSSIINRMVLCYFQILIIIQYFHSDQAHYRLWFSNTLKHIRLGTMSRAVFGWYPPQWSNFLLETYSQGSPYHHWSLTFVCSTRLYSADGYSFLSGKQCFCEETRKDVFEEVFFFRINKEILEETA